MIESHTFDDFDLEDPVGLEHIEKVHLVGRKLGQEMGDAIYATHDQDVGERRVITTQALTQGFSPLSSSSNPNPEEILLQHNTEVAFHQIFEAGDNRDFPISERELTPDAAFHLAENGFRLGRFLRFAFNQTSREAAHAPISPAILQVSRARLIGALAEGIVLNGREFGYGSLEFQSAQASQMDVLRSSFNSLFALHSPPQT